MSTTEHERFEQDGAAYLLGALPPLEAEVFERHLMACATCQRELERLRPAAQALPRAVEAFEPPPSLKRSLMDVVEAEAAAAGTGAPLAEPARTEPARTEPAPPPPLERRSRTSFYPKGVRAPGWLAGLRPRAALALASVVLLAGVALGLGLAQGGGDDAE
ncbi:MAG TPA: zf-HC2 domain-containing protein, partial [Thermoleophilaceae bacterium]